MLDRRPRVSMRCPFALVLLLLCLCSSSDLLHAHAMRTAYLELRESSPGKAVAAWKTPLPKSGAFPEIEGCEISSEAERGEGGRSSAYVRQFSFRCPSALAGRRVRIKGLGLTVNEAVVRIINSEGTVASKVLGPSHPSWIIPVEPWTRVVSRAAREGWKATLGRLEPVLCLLGLFLLICSSQRQRKAKGKSERESAFWGVCHPALVLLLLAVAHAGAMFLLAISLIRLNPLTVQTCFAICFVFLGLNIGRESTRKLESFGLLLLSVVMYGFSSAAGIQPQAHALELDLHALAGHEAGILMGWVVLTFALALASSAIQRIAERSAFASSGRTSLALSTLGGYVVGSFGVFSLLCLSGRLFGR